MESRARLFGHPIHQMLISLPVGLFVTAIGFDIVFYATATPQWAQVSFWLIGVGIVTGLIAAVFGLMDYVAIPADTRARRVGTLHGIGNVIVVALFATSWYLRHNNPAAPSNTAMLVSAGGFMLLCVTAWLGGELVDRLGIGVDSGAHVDAPSSLSHKVVARTANRPTM